MSSLKNPLKPKKNKKKSHASRISSGSVDLSPVAEHDEDATDLNPERKIGRRLHKMRQPENMLDYPQHQRASSSYGDSVGGDGGCLNDFAPPFFKDGTKRSTKMYSDMTQHAIHDFVESTNAQRLEEEELLKRAMDRRDMLHNRIAAIEVAKAELSNNNNDREVPSEKEKKKSKRIRHHRAKSSNSASSGGSRPFDEDSHSKDSLQRRALLEERKMDEISERIKKEATEFMNFESKFADQYLFDRDEVAQIDNTESGDSDSFQDAYDGGNEFYTFEDARDNSCDEDNSQLHEEVSHCSASDTMTIHSSDSNMDSALSGAPTPSQLSRYANMVRLGIPDVAVLRSMERDEIVNPEKILESLKKDNNVQQSSSTTPESSYISPRPTAKKNSGGHQSSIISSPTLTSDGGMGSPKRPLCDDPNYTKYFKMLKAKVPRSWVKRVLEVDGRDARILQLDPNRPLSEQVDEDEIDEEGNINWKNVVISRSESTESSDSEKEERPVLAIPKDIGESVKAELAAMTAKAGEFARSRSTHNSFTRISFSSRDRDETTATAAPADISAAAIAASNARLNRLKALRDKSGDDSSISKLELGRRRENVDEIRRRRRAPHPSQASRDRHSPTSSSSVASCDAASKKKGYEDLPLKDDPRFSKYFQMIRSRVPRSWVERVIEVDDRDPAILDLDPNRSLASQVGDEMTVKTYRSSVVSLDATERSSEKSSDGDIIEENDQKDEAINEKYEDDVLSCGLPVTEINDTQADDVSSEASSITASQVDKPRLDLSKVTAFFDRLDPDNEAQNVPQDNLQVVDQERLERVRLYSSEEIENRVAALLEKFGARKAYEEQNQFSLRQKELLQKSQSDIAKLTSLLSAKINEDGTSENQNQDLSGEPSNIENLPSLLAQVLSRIEQSNQKQGIVESVEEQISIQQIKPSLHEASGALFAKRAAKAQESSDTVAGDTVKPSPHNALEALFAKRAAQTVDNTEKKETQETKKQSVGGKNSALEAMFAKRAVAMDTSLTGVSSAKPLKDDPEYQKYTKMLKMGMPLQTVKQALERDGKDPLIAEMDPDKSYESQANNERIKPAEIDPPLKDLPEYAKFFKMLKMGIPNGAVRQALQKEGKDPDIADMDPDKSLSSQQKSKPEDDVADSPLQDDPEYAKFFKMLKMGIPVGAVQNALKKEGKDPGIINMDPARPLSAQGKSTTSEVSRPKNNANPPKVARKRLHWNKIDESKLDASSFWNQADQSIQLVGLDIDNEEFANLFTSPINNEAASKKEANNDTKKIPSKQKVQLIDSRRRMNGSILLAKFKVDYNLLAKQVNAMEYVQAEANELRGMMQLLPTKDESLALRSYLPPADAPRTEIEDSMNKLGECERYMAVMLDVPDANSKFECMVFRAEFELHAEHIRDGTKMLAEACNAVKNSERFRKLLLYALKLGNALNTGGSNESVSAITLDSLLKLAEAKSFDRQTSVLHYLVSIVEKNDADVLKLSEDFIPVKAAERVAMDMLSSEITKMNQGIKNVQCVVKRNLPESCDSGSEREEDDLLDSTPMGRFAISAASKIKSLTNEFDDAKRSFSDLLRFFGEDSSMSPEAFFCTINTFASMFDQTHKELVRKEEAKARRKRIEEKQKLRKEEMAAKKAKS